MAAFPATDVAFEGFRLARENPRSILLWSALMLLLSLLSALLLVTMAGPAMNELMTASAEAQPDPDESLAVIAQLAPVYALLTPLSLALYAVLFAAVFRAILRPSEAAAVGHLRLGGDELRQVLALAAVFLLLTAGYFVLLLGAGLLVGLAVMVFKPASGLLTVLAVLAAISGLVWLSVRLSLVAPLTFDRKRLDLGAAWRMTRGVFWPLLGSYVLSSFLMIVVALLGLVIFTALGVLLGGGVEAIGAFFRPDFSSVGSYFTPMMLAYLVVGSVLNTLTFAIVVGAPAAAYRVLSTATKPSALTQ